MKFVALVSGGKDSFFNIHHCLSNGHELVALGNLYPQETDRDEIDSFMFQTVGHDIIDSYSECLDVPLYRQAITGSSSNQQLEYSITENDEIEDLYKLLLQVKEKHPDLEAVSCGAILSHYQRTRVENVCGRLNLTSLTYLWQRNQEELMQEMISNDLDARLIKVAAIGLNAKHLGKSISEVFPHLLKLNQMYDVHVCGEGGEFETIVLDSPIFKFKKLQITEHEVINHSSDDVSYLKIKVVVVEKEEQSNYVKISPPNLLDSKFEEVLESLDSDSLEALTLNEPSESVSSTYEFKKPPSIIQSPTKLYITNLTSSQETVEDQAGEIFKSLGTILQRNELSFNNIQHITMLLSDMSYFEKVNGIYSKSFESLYLPPSRICVETAMSSSIMLSCIVLKEQVPSKKSGLHIRSRSYWAPQNIGPYSQTSVEIRESYKLSTLSGQIPLIPSSMSLSQNTIQHNSVFSLQHLYRVKELISCTKLGSIICFVTHQRFVSTAAKTWEEYTSSIENEFNQGQLVIVKVSSLPKGAEIEWGGISYESIVGMYDDSDDEEKADEKKHELTDSIRQFDGHFISQIANGSMNIVTLFSNNSDHITSFIKQNCSKSYIQVITTDENMKYLDLKQEELIEYLPVQGVYDSRGRAYKYSLIWKYEQQ
ncbi:adenine nucleotide alpha hydrolase [Scheffersomyces xylosifermentans]|uniref:adenine nucleotide alpha hydrolase n=1 Tax=Scheffersomyces xylosifermentans TaxID=1304137 RepID=UPI00315C6543